MGSNSKEYNNKWYAENREKRQREERERQAEKRRWYNDEVKRPCERCGESNPVVLDFHHVDPSNKSFELSSRWKSGSRTRILSEVAKCVSLCANCHRIVEHEKRMESTAERLATTLEK